MVNHPYHKDSAIFFALVGLFIMGTIGLFMWMVLRGERQITSYTECLQSKSSKILEMYPQICVTAGGKRFVQPLSDEDMQKILPPADQQSEKPDEFAVASTSARLYSAPGGTFSLTLPAGWVVNQTETTADLDRDKTHAIELVKADEERLYPIGRIIIDYTDVTSNFDMSVWRNSFIPPEVAFGPEKSTFGGVVFDRVESSESGGFTESSNTDSYFGMTGKTALGISAHFQQPIEQAEQQAILTTFQFLP
jgi:hypothetical protein